MEKAVLGQMEAVIAAELLLQPDKKGTSMELVNKCERENTDGIADCSLTFARSTRIFAWMQGEKSAKK